MLPLLQLAFSDSAFGDIFVRDNHAIVVATERSDMEPEPALCSRRMARVLQGKVVEPTGKYSFDPIKRGQSEVVTGFRGAATYFQVVHASSDLAWICAVLGGKSIPRLVGVQDVSALVEHGDARSQGVQDPPAELLLLTQILEESLPICCVSQCTKKRLT